MIICGIGSQYTHYMSLRRTTAIIMLILYVEQFFTWEIPAILINRYHLIIPYARFWFEASIAHYPIYDKFEVYIRELTKYYPSCIFYFTIFKYPEIVSLYTLWEHHLSCQDHLMGHIYMCVGHVMSVRCYRGGWERFTFTHQYLGCCQISGIFAFYIPSSLMRP